MGCGVQESVGENFAVKVVQRNSSFGNTLLALVFTFQH